jgi:hypothetical protein
MCIVVAIFSLNIATGTNEQATDITPFHGLKLLWTKLFSEDIKWGSWDKFGHEALQQEEQRTSIWNSCIFTFRDCKKKCKMLESLRTTHIIRGCRVVYSHVRLIIRHYYSHYKGVIIYCGISAQSRNCGARETAFASNRL